MSFSINSDNWLQELEQNDWTLLQLSPEFCTRIQAYARELDQQSCFTPAALAEQAHSNIRNDRTFWIQDDTKHPVGIEILHFLDQIKNSLRDYFRISLTHYECHLAIFDEGHFYHKHTDQKKTDNHRFFSFVIYLNSDWSDTDGGQLAIYKDNEPPIFIQPEMPQMIIFKSELLHEVLVAQRQRLSLTGWMRTH